ncbi:MAG TPA: GyrI-like domain-containing protein [Ohtaekwangia sp.]|uniref:GyrI-like domain-containing protein n=1 Tax=Ohtaekwangia sp. TaxID=2066019 RepID=UPI002F939CC9
MKIQEVKPINFLFFRTETRVHELVNFLPIGQKLFREAVQQQLAITGPVHWHYFGFTGDEQKTFTLEIALPVADVSRDYDGEFHFKRTEPFRCASITHEGEWSKMPVSYSKLMAFIAGHKLTPNAISREIYVNADFLHPEANVVEIQVGVQ